MSVELVSSKKEYVGISINRYYLAWEIAKPYLRPDDLARIANECMLDDEETEEHKWMKRRILK